VRSATTAGAWWCANGHAEPRTITTAAGAISPNLARMEKRGPVVREECEEDARGLMVRITPGGRRAIEAAAPAHVEAVQRHFFDLLSKKELETLGAFFDRVLDTLADDAG
jgi:DNA-binding MarR family transcriptional regulator